MNQSLILLIKFVSSVIAFAIALDLFFEASIADIVSFSILITVVSYMLGDRMILPLLGKRNALIADFFLVYAAVWVFGSVLLHSYLQIAWGSIIAAGIISLAEIFVHRYMASSTEDQRKEFGLKPRLAYGMELGEEKDPLKD